MAENKGKEIHGKTLWEKAKESTYKEDVYNSKGELKHSKGEKIVGGFDENTGGGTPMGREQKLEIGGRGTWTKNYGQKPPRANNQPRTDDGQFTYASANNHGLAKTSDPTRNHTVNPALVGGKNNIDKDEAARQIKAKKGEIYEMFESWMNDSLIQSGKYAYEGKIYNINYKGAKTYFSEYLKLTGKVKSVDEKGREQELKYVSSRTDESGNKPVEHVKHGDISTSQDEKSPVGFDTKAKAIAEVKKGRRSEEEKRVLSDKTYKLRKHIFSNIDNPENYISKNPTGVKFGGLKIKIDSMRQFMKDTYNKIKSNVASAKQEAKQESSERVKNIGKFDFKF